MNPIIKIIVSILLSISTIAFIIVWEVYFKDEIDSVKVLVVADGVEIQENEVINGDEFVVEHRRRADLIEGVLYEDDLQRIIGYDAARHMVANAMVTEYDIDFEQIEPDPTKGEAIRPIPNEWIYAKPGSLRRKDKINIYLVDQHFRDTKTEMTAQGFTNVIDDDLLEKVKDESLSEKEREQLVKASVIPLLEEVRVIYAKDGSGNEIIDISDEERMNASGNIVNLELNLNDEEFNLVMKYIKENYRMYITYH